jgi:hypothetical protein
MNARFLRAIVVFVLFVSTTAGLEAGPLDVWHWRNPTSTGNTLYGVCYGMDKYVAVGERGTIVFSPDSINWFNQESGTTLELRSVCFGNGMFIAAGELGAIFVSLDGLNWSRVFTPYLYDLHGITFGSNQFVAVGQGGIVLTSTNGTTWTQRTSGSFDLNGIAFGNSRFVAVGWNPVSEQSVALVSLDGTNWISSIPAVPGKLNAIGFGNGIFVTASAASTFTQTFFQNSSDGFSWVPTQSVFFNQINTIAFGDGRFIALGGDDTTAYGSFLESENALTWQQLEFGVSTPHVPNAMVYGPDGFVAVGGTKDFIRYGILGLPNGSLVWQERARQINWSPTKIKYVHDRYFLLDYYGTNIATSGDGVFWETHFPPANAPIADITSDGQKFLAVGASNILVSRDGENWSVVSTSSNAVLNAVAWGDNQFVAVGPGISGTSIDGTNWSWLEVADFNPDRIYFGAGRFLAYNSQYWYGPSSLHISTNGNLWAVHTSATNFQYLTFADGEFLGAAGNQIMISSNALDWRVIHLDSGSSVIALTRTHGTIVAVANNGNYAWNRVLSSTNEMTWKEHDRPAAYLFNLATDNNRVLLLGGSGVLLQSDPLTAAAPSIIRAPTSIAAAIGSAVTLQAAATGTSPLHYQWFRDGLPIAGATHEYLAFPNVQLTNSTEYSLSISNSLGATNTPPIQLTVGVAPQLQIGGGPSPEITIIGSPNRPYRIEYATDLATSLWQTWTNVILVNSNQTLSIDGFDPTTNHFYRALLIP